MTRRESVMAAVGSLAVVSMLSAKEENSMRELLEASLNEKKSVMLYMKGQSIGGAVLRIAGDAVELRNREYSRIVVRLDAIDAIAMI